MKKILALLLVATFCLSAFAGCSKEDEKEENVDKGAVVNMFLTYMPADLDPGKICFDSSLMQFYGLLYEGLTTLSSNGKLEKVLAKDWEYEVDKRDDQLKLQITLNSNYWSDGIPVDADDFVYAWKRLLLPETVNSAASLLFPIKNAVKVKSGELTIDDIGVHSVGDYILEIVFEEGFTDVEYFLQSTASPALVPIREDIVSKGDTWAQEAGTIITNGPFRVESWSSKDMLLERNAYYKGLNNNANFKPWKFVTPYKIFIDYSTKNDAQIEKFNKEENFYVGEFSKESYDKYKKDIKTQDEMSTYTYLFNTKNKVLSNEKGRKALSIALDRNEIAKIIGRGTKAATGFVPTGILDPATKKDFRKKAGNLITTKGQLDEAKSLLKDAGLTNGGRITIKYLKHDGGDSWELDVAEYVKSVWEKMGFIVTLQPVKSKLFNQTLITGDFDILGLDFQALTKDAYSFVMPFGLKTSGSAISVDTEKIEFTPYITGFQDDEYDAVIDSILTAKNNKERAPLFYVAEKMLIDKSVVAPLVFNTDAYIASNKLNGIKTNFFAQKNLAKMSLKHYEKYLPVVEK